MNNYVEIAALYARVGEQHRRMAEAARAGGDGEPEQHHHERAAAAWQWAHHYSCMALDVCSMEAHERDERTAARCCHADHR